MAIVTTGDAASVAQDSAVIVGNAFSGFTWPINFVAVQYATRPDMCMPMAAYGVAESPFSVTLTGLEPGTEYFYRAVVCTCDGRYCVGEIKSFVTLQPVPVPMVATGDAVNIGENAATIIGNTFSGISGAIEFVGVQYDIDPDMSGPLTAYGAIGSPFSVDLTGLQPDTTYYYRAIVGTSGDAYEGAVKSFVTPLPAPAPLVTTGDATQVLENSAIIVNNAFSGIAGTVDFVGVQYATNLAMSDAVLIQSVVESPFTVGLTGLQPNTTYYYRAVVGASSGLHYGEIKSFVTPAMALIVVTGDATNILSGSATIVNNQFSGIAETINFVGVQYSISPSMVSAVTASAITIGSPFAVNLTALQPNTTYYFRAAVSTTRDTYFGEIKSFTTPNRV